MRTTMTRVTITYGCVLVLRGWILFTGVLSQSVTNGLMPTIRQANAYQEQLRLVSTLLDEERYNPIIRPVKNASSLVNVTIGMSLRLLRELNIRQQYVQLQAWLRLFWVDELLRWDPAEYGGVKVLRIPSSMMWRPDIALYGHADTERNALEIVSETNIIVNFKGSATMLWPSLVTASCQIDVQNYPFDHQKCILQFGSWTYDGYQLDLYSERPQADLNKIIPHSEIEIVSAKATRNVEYYACCPEPYVDVQYAVLLHRHPLYYTINFILPCMCIEILTVLVFLLPIECGEKVSLAVTLMLGVAVLLLVIAENTPPSSTSVPLIGMYFMMTIAISSAATLVTVLVLNVYYHGDHGRKVPRWLKVVILRYLAIVTLTYPTTRFVFAREVEAQKKSQRVMREISSSHATQQHQPLVNGTDVSSCIAEDPSLATQLSMKPKLPWITEYEHIAAMTVKRSKANNESLKAITDGKMNKGDTETQLIRAKLAEIGKQLGSMSVSLEALQDMRDEALKQKLEDDALEETKYEWKLVAAVIDRFFFFVFIGTSVVCTIGVLYNGYFTSDENH